MDNEKYDLVFKAELVAGFGSAQVKKNLKLLFRISEAQVEALFTGKAISLKKNLDADTANKYRVAMKKAGAKVNVVQSQVPEPSQAAAQKPLHSQVQNSVNTPAANTYASSASQAGSVYQTELGAQPVKPSPPKPVIKAPDFGVGGVGEELLGANEREVVVPVPVDVSHLSVSQQQGNLVAPHELAQLEPLVIDIPDLDVAPSGEDLLRPQERVVVTPVQVDTSNLSVGPVGETLAPKKAISPPPPNVDHIKLAD